MFSPLSLSQQARPKFSACWFTVSRCEIMWPLLVHILESESSVDATSTLSWYPTNVNNCIRVDTVGIRLYCCMYVRMSVLQYTAYCSRCHFVSAWPCLHYPAVRQNHFGIPDHLFQRSMPHARGQAAMAARFTADVSGFSSTKARAAIKKKDWDAVRKIQSRFCCMHPRTNTV